MITNILEYAVFDVYYQLWLAAKQADKNPVDSGRTYTRRDWNPALLEQFDDPNDIPDSITVKEGNSHHMNSDYRFHLGRKDPSLVIPEMTIMWVDEERHEHRETGPAKIVLADVKKWHNNGLLHRRRGDAFICKQASYTWAKHGMFTRNNGPYHISLRGISAKGKNGAVSDWKLDGMVPSWNTDSGRRLSQLQVKEAISQNDLEINYLANDSVFNSDVDEFVFLTEIAE